jgi:dienelactone hydrolase
MRTSIFLVACVVSSALASPALAAVKTKAITYNQGDMQFSGFLAWDDSLPGKRPGVLVVHEWWGLNDYARERATKLAALGYVAFAADMYGEGKTAKHPTEAREMATKVRSNVKNWQERATAALEVLKSQEQCDASNLAAIGYCFGGSTALQLAYTGADLKAVATFHAALVAPDAAQAKQIKARILVCHGADDPFISKESIDGFRTALDGAKADWTMVNYSGARHSFTVPSADSHNIDGMKYHALADQRSWQHLQTLLGEVFGK